MSTTARRSVTESDIVIPAQLVQLPGSLAVPKGASSVVLFAHGSGSSRFSRRNRFVAGVLQDHGIGTLLFDLLTESEGLDRRNVFDIPLLATRLGAATERVLHVLGSDGLALGYFGASTGAAAALAATAARDHRVRAIVSRGGRPDLASAHLREITTPTLLIVGGADHQVLQLNRQALAELGGEKALEIVPGASHLFEEPGALEQVAALAATWFARYLTTSGRAASVS